MLTVNRLELGCTTNYLYNTIDSLKRSNIFESKIPFHFFLHDSGSKNTDFLKCVDGLPHTTIIYQQQKLTEAQNFMSLLRYASKLDSEIIILLEDDLIFCKNFLESVDTWITRYFVRPYALASFYTPYSQVLHAFHQKQYTWDYPIIGFYASLCCAIQKDELLPLAEYIENNQHTIRHGDMLIKSYFLSKNLPHPYFLASVPSFVQHIGIESSTHPGANKRECQCWLGEQKSFIDLLTHQN